MKRTATLKQAGRHTRFSDNEWNFPEERVPSEQLIACCYWEYARESDFIRGVLRNLKGVKAGLASTQPLETANRDLTRLYSIGTPVELFLRLPFPKPWQSLDSLQRKEGHNFVPEIPKPVKLPPFQPTNSYRVASDLYSQARAIQEKQWVRYGRLSQIDRGAANLKEAAELELEGQLAEEERNPTPVLVRGGGGVDSFIAQINWRDFDDTEIVQCFERWVKAKGNRAMPVTQQPKGVRGIKGGRGRDPYAWRASLQRLGFLRLRHALTVDQAIQIIAKQLPRKQRFSTKFTNPGELNREAGKAVDDFHALLPFLDPDEMPRSWPMK